MIHVPSFIVSMRSGFINRLWIAIAISLFSFAASAQTYPISGVWVAIDARFPGSTAGACLLLKELGVDVVITQPFPTVMIFSEDKRFEVRGEYLAERKIKSIKGAIDGGFRITERWRPFSKRQVLTLKVFDPTTIEVTEGKVSTRFSKCSSSGPSV